MRFGYVFMRLKPDFWRKPLYIQLKDEKVTMVCDDIIVIPSLTLLQLLLLAASSSSSSNGPQDEKVLDGK